LALFLHFFLEESFDTSRLDSTNGPAQDPPAVPHAVGARSYAALTGRSRVEISSLTCKSAVVQDALGHKSLLEITPWYKADGRNSSTLPERAKLARGGIHGSS
jgi:hypothetical protein